MLLCYLTGCFIVACLGRGLKGCAGSIDCEASSWGGEAMIIGERAMMRGWCGREMDWDRGRRGGKKPELVGRRLGGSGVRA
jgi:hypothetical protein